MTEMFVLTQRGFKYDNGMRNCTDVILRGTEQQCRDEMAQWVAAGQKGLTIKPSPLTAAERSLAQRRAMLASFK